MGLSFVFSIIRHICITKHYITQCFLFELYKKYIILLLTLVFFISHHASNMHPYCHMKLKVIHLYCLEYHNLFLLFPVGAHWGCVQLFDNYTVSASIPRLISQCTCASVFLGRVSRLRCYWHFGPSAALLWRAVFCLVRHSILVGRLCASCFSTIKSVASSLGLCVVKRKTPDEFRIGLCPRISLYHSKPAKYC